MDAVEIEVKKRLIEKDIERLRVLKMEQEQKAAEFLMKANDTDARITRLRTKLDKLQEVQ